MKKLGSTGIALAVFIAFGALYGIITTSFFDYLVNVMWTPLAIALYVLIFALLLSVITIIVVKKLGNKIERKLLVRDMAIVLVVLFLATMLFEVLYEIEPEVEIKEPDSYIILLDDSGSMEVSDPENKRLSAVSKLVSGKPSNFEYAVYTFSGNVDMIRGMQPKSNGFNPVELKSEGGTALFGSLETVINDISTGKLKMTDSTRVLLLSDGEAGDSPLSKGKLLRQFVNKNMVISTIGLGEYVDVETMEQIAEYTGGVYVQVDDAEQLDTAMVDASVGRASRNLLGYRGFCRTNTLHAVLRIVFMLIIVGLIYILKIYSYGKYYTPNVVISAICCVAAALLPEIGLEVLFWNDNVMRVVMCILIAITIVEVIVGTPPRRRVDDEFEATDYDLGDPDNLEAKKQEPERNISVIE